MSRSRSWCLTINNPSEFERSIPTIYQLELDCIRYGIIAEEVGESGTPHLQGYIYFHTEKSMKAVKKLKFMERAHLEQAKGTPLQASNYCKKDGKYIEWGELPQQGKRTDLDQIRELIASGRGMSDIVEVATSYQSVRMAEVILKYKEKPRTWKPEVFWFWGPTGTGKSKTAYEMMPDAYTCMSTGKWFEGYDAHQDVIVDDMRKDFMKFHEILTFLDRYAFRVETKGGSRQFLAKRLIITSCHHPAQLFDTREDIQQLLRRIDHIEEFV